jgi:hypothetical protein
MTHRHICIGCEQQFRCNSVCNFNEQKFALCHGCKYLMECLQSLAEGIKHCKLNDFQLDFSPQKKSYTYLEMQTRRWL